MSDATDDPTPEETKTAPIFYSSSLIGWRCEIRLRNPKCRRRLVINPKPGELLVFSQRGATAGEEQFVAR